jgi:multimeric flavodoxin WrbA
MKTIIVTECDVVSLSDTITFDLNSMKISNCIGCFSCWVKTPGKCVFNDLSEFYHHYITADKVIFIAKVSKGFVTGNMKTLFDRMLPLFLPYIVYDTGESMHVPRYEKYPDIEFYYKDSFANEEERKIYADYIQRVFYQFHSNTIVVKPIEQLCAIGGVK